MASPVPPSNVPAPSATISPDPSAALEALRTTLSHAAESGAGKGLLVPLAKAQAEAARAIAGLSRGQLSPHVERAIGLSTALRATGAFDAGPAVEADAMVGAGGLLARMLIGPAWQSASTPLLGDVPEAWWGAYTEWLFAAPRRFLAPGAADRYAAHFLRHAGELARWAERNPGSAAVRAALAAYFSVLQPLPLLVSAGGLGRHAGVHGRILAAAGGSRRPQDLPVATATGRRLRLAFVASSPEDLPGCHRLMDAQRFEVSTFALAGVAAEEDGGSADIAVSAILSLLHSDRSSQECRQLPRSLAEQLKELAAVEPDVVVYGGDLAFSAEPLARLAAQRIAPLQIALLPGGVTSGLSSMDLCVVGEAGFTGDFAPQFSERVAVIPGSGHLFADLPPAEVSAARARAALSLPESACVVVTVVRMAEITPGKLRQWTALLQRIPSVTLVIQLLQSADHPFAAIEALGQEWDAGLTAAGVEPSRGLLLATAVASLPELQSVIVAADIFLDSGTLGEPAVLHLPLALGVPIVATRGPDLRTRSGAGLLGAIGCDECVAPDDGQLLEMIAGLAEDGTRRADLSARLRSAMERLPLCRDPLAAAESLGQVVTRAWSDLHELGAHRFRTAGPLWPALPPGKSRGDLLRLGHRALEANDAAGALARAREIFAAAPGDVEARWLAGRALLAASRPAVAVDYLLAAIQGLDDAGAWYDLAVALHRNGQTTEALQALEASLRREGGRADAWVMLIELARAVGAEETAQEAMEALRICAPDDPRIPELVSAPNPAAQAV